MTLYEKFLLVLALWTLTEGAFVFTFPRAARQLTRKLFPKIGEFLEKYQPSDLRRLAAVEFLFGTILGVYLYLQLR